MMKKILLFMMANLFFVNLGSAAPEDYQISSNCFDDEDYCHSYGIEYNAELDRKVIRVRFSAQLYVDDYDGVDALTELFLDFDSWDDYTASMADYDKVSDALDDCDIVFISTVGGAMLHTVDYWTSAPWPLGKLQVKERSIYEELDDSQALRAYKFYLDPTYDNKGIKYKTGYIRMYQDDDMYYATVVLDIVPEIDFLPSVAAPYVSKGLVAIFKGMFDM